MNQDNDEAAKAEAPDSPLNPPTHADAPATPTGPHAEADASTPAPLDDTASSPSTQAGALGLPATQEAGSPSGTVETTAPEHAPPSPAVSASASEGAGAPSDTPTNVSTGGDHERKVLETRSPVTIAPTQRAPLKVLDRRGKNGYVPPAPRETVRGIGRTPDAQAIREAHVGLWNLSKLLRSEIEEAESAKARLDAAKKPSERLDDFLAGMKRGLHDVLSLHAQTYEMDLMDRLADVTDGMRQAHSLATKAGIKIPGPAPRVK